MWQPPEGIEEYLEPTQLCDCDNEELKRRAKEIIAGAETPKEAAPKIFSFVRDEVIYEAGHHDAKASRILKKGGGSCTTKSNLQTALLRAVGIPARYHQVSLKKESIKGIFSGFIYNKLPEPIWFHPWCECYLGGKWVACEALFDEALFRAMLRQGLVTEEQIPTIDWDGENDLVVVRSWVVEDTGTFASLDDVFRRAEKETHRPKILASLLGWFVVFLSNRHTNGIRKEK